MKIGEPNESAWIIEDKLPPVCQPVIVVSAGYRCLGYANALGVWHAWLGDRELKSVTGWMPEAAPQVLYFKSASAC